MQSTENTKTTPDEDLRTIRKYIVHPAGSLPFEPALEALDRISTLVQRFHPASLPTYQKREQLEVEPNG